MRIIEHRKFYKQFTKLPKEIKEKFKERYLIFLANQYDPILDNHPLHPPFAGSRSINITGDYRAIFKQVSDDLIIFTEIGTHHELFGT